MLIECSFVGVRARGAGAGGAPTFWAIRIFFGKQEKFGQNQFLKKFPYFFPRGILFVWFDRPGESSPEKDCCW